MEPLSNKTFQRAIVHFDGDSFFASVEQALNHTLKGKPIITGAERGAATSVSVEAKRLGLRRGMTLKEMREVCPEVIVVSSDYTAYSIFARRMYAIVRRFTPNVEEYSIDECFADITHLAESSRGYETIARTIQDELHTALGVTFGVGLAPTKVLAKTASKYRKPAGFTSIPAHEAHEYLKDIPASSIWGIGPSMSVHLRSLGIKTALEFASVSPQWLQDSSIAKPYRAIWQELRGILVNEVRTEYNPQDIQSIMKTRTFAPPSTDRAFIYSQLCKNIEKACAQARRARMRAREIGIYLKTQEFLYGRRESTLSVPTNDPREILKVVELSFKTLFRRGVLYRATGVVLRQLVTEEATTPDLFGAFARVAEKQSVLASIDAVNKRFGKDTIHFSSSARAFLHTDPDRRSTSAKRRSVVSMPIEQKKKTIDLPYLGRVS